LPYVKVLKKVKKKKRMKLVPFWFLISFLSLLFLCLLYVKQTSDLLSGGYELGRLKKELKKWHEEENYLKVCLARLKSPARIKKEAEKKCGLVPSREGEIVFLDFSPQTKKLKKTQDKDE
jgi:cell division protein FtsL